MIEYRKATIADSEALARIRSTFMAEVNHIHSDAHILSMARANKAYFDQALANNSFVAWITLCGQEIIATSGLCFSVVPPSFSCPDGKVAYIMNLYTLPGYRKQGLAMELLKRNVEEAKMRGYTKITLTATAMGKPLYEKFGFKDVQGDMVYYSK